MKNDLNGGISSVSPIPSFSIMETCSGVTTAFAMTSPSLFFLPYITSIPQKNSNVNKKMQPSCTFLHFFQIL